MAAPTIEEHPLQHAPDASPRRSAGRMFDWRQALGGALIVAGLVAVFVAWYGISGTTETWRQFPYLASGGVGGAALLAVGVTLLIGYEHARDRDAIAILLDRIDQLETKIDELSAPGSE